MKPKQAVDTIQAMVIAHASIRQFMCEIKGMSLDEIVAFVAENRPSAETIAMLAQFVGWANDSSTEEFAKRLRKPPRTWLEKQP
jgi:hypothetical protein